MPNVGMFGKAQNRSKPICRIICKFGVGSATVRKRPLISFPPEHLRFTSWTGVETQARPIGKRFLTRSNCHASLTSSVSESIVISNDLLRIRAGVLSSNVTCINRTVKKRKLDALLSWIIITRAEISDVPLTGSTNLWETILRHYRASSKNIQFRLKIPDYEDAGAWSVELSRRCIQQWRSFLHGQLF